LKIDKFFVDSAVEKEEDAAFVRMIIGIAKSLNLELIAEGVETKEQLEFLRSEGCSMIQGYYFSKPLPPAEVLTFLQHSNGLNRSSSIKQLA
jgi:EAL domain-containing protein (putative c-di-GMP-specific phosphodiesterase class I)